MSFHYDAYVDLGKHDHIRYIYQVVSHNCVVNVIKIHIIPDIIEYISCIMMKFGVLTEKNVLFSNM